MYDATVNVNKSKKNEWILLRVVYEASTSVWPKVSMFILEKIVTSSISCNTDFRNGAVIGIV
jgi:hypothetical protein